MKTPVVFNFSQGVDTKVDPWQVPVGRFLELVNTVFQTPGLMQKRPGYGELTLDTPPSTFITTLNANLVSIGSTVNAFSDSLEKWVTKGTLQPCAPKVLSLIRNNYNLTQIDSAISGNLVLSVYTQTFTSVSAVTTQYRFVIADSVTGQNIVSPTALPVLSTGVIQGSSRAFVIGNYFVIVSPVTVSGSTSLQYVSIPIMNPITSAGVANVSAAQNVTADVYVPLQSNPGWDGVAVNVGSTNQLVVAYNTTTGGQGIHVATLTANQIANNQSSATILAFTNALYKAALLTICVDLTVTPNIYYVSFWDSTTSNGYTLAVFTGFGTITQQFAPQQIISSVAVVNLASAAQNGSCLVFDEVSNNYGYDSTIPTHYITGVTVSSAGSVGTPYVAIRSVGLASKAFVISGKIYFLSAYQSPFQPTYFLINGSSTTAAVPVTVAKLAYQTGNGYVTLGLPSVNISGSIGSVAYLLKTLIEPITNETNTQQTATGGVYSQIGANLASFDVGTPDVNAIEMANSLQISGGFMGQFDGYLPVEQNFFLYPDSVETTYEANSEVTPTGSWASGDSSITVSDATGIYPNMTIADTSNSSYIQAGTKITTVNGTTIGLSLPTTHLASGDTLSIKGNIVAKPDSATNTNAYAYQWIYTWQDNQGFIHRSAPSIPIFVTTSGSATIGTITNKIPTLRLTSKVANVVKLEGYRWSVGNQVYQQVTSITAPVLNDTTVDYLTFVDTLPDSAIEGNEILYTTGGVVPNINAPGSDIMTKFDTRILVMDPENPNTAWISKQVIPGTPVEFSTRFTIYVSPTFGVNESLGPVQVVSAMDDKAVFWFNGGIAYMNGVGPDNLGTTSAGCPLGNYSQPTYIPSPVGSDNQKSVVQIPNGLMFQASQEQGIWLLGRDLSVRYIGADVERFNNFRVTSAKVIPGTNYVLFTLNTNVFLMYDFFVNQWGWFEGVSATSSCVYQNLHTVLDEFGAILQQTPGEYLDRTNPVLMRFKTGWLNLASLQGYERFYDFYFLGKYLSPHRILCEVAYDYNDSILHNKIVTPNNMIGIDPSPFGVPVPYGSSSNRLQERIHAKQQLCQSFQLTLSEKIDPLKPSESGAGFTMSGITARLLIKSATRPIRGANTAGMS